MPIGAADLERKIQHLDNDVQSIYEVLSVIQGTQWRHNNRFSELSDQIMVVDGKVSALEARFDGLEGRFDSFQSQMDQVLELLKSR